MLLLSLSLTARAQSGAPTTVPKAAVPGSASLDGLWQGPLTVPGGQLAVSFRLVRLSSGDYFATLDVPQQRVSRMAVQVETMGDTVRFNAVEANTVFVGWRTNGGQQLTGVWQQPGFQTPLTLSLTVAPAASPTPKVTRLTPPYREEEVAFSSASTPLRGELTLPPGAKKVAAVVLLSDAGTEDRNGTQQGFGPLGYLADYLTRRGIAVLRFDNRGAGQSEGTPSADLAGRVADAQAALRYLRTRPEVDLAHLGLIGHGEGGNVALLTAGQAQPPAFVVTMAASGLPGAELVMQQQEAKLRAAGLSGAALAAALKRQSAVLEAIRQTPDDAAAQASVTSLLRNGTPALDSTAALAAARTMTTPQYRRFLTRNPAAQLTGITCPVLLLHGTADPVADADANLSALNQEMIYKTDLDITRKKLAGVNHQFQSPPATWPMANGQPWPTFSPQAAETIRKWIMELLAL